MKFTKTLWLFLLLITTHCYATAQNNAEQEVRKLERAWLDAYEKSDAEAMNKIVADDFTITFPDGSIQTKLQILDSLKPLRNSPPPKFHTEEVQARVYGDTVILIGRVVTEWQNGQPMKEQSRYTDTYVKQNGRWQVVASHLSSVPKPQNQNQAVSSNAGQGRSLNKNKIVSIKNPPIRIDVDEQMPHVGILKFKLKEVAQVERYIYASHDESKRIQRFFIAQFEAFLPDIKGEYKFQVTNPTRLGNNDYQTDIGIFNFAERIASNPGAEAEHTKALLDKSGLKADDDFLVARYARITSDDSVVN
ncbi:MAG: nuclear transport factor 2 family protein [Acidobacteriota bacterium]|nr:nuclear transport factor 2 family protein [Acidobacteriota bacterium]